MFTFKTLPAIALVAFGSVALIPACAVTPADGDSAADVDTDGEEGVAAAALTGTGKSCTADSACVSGDYCVPHCPVIPGRFHCEIAGGTCEPRCTRTSASLHGETFTSSDGAHSVTFSSSGTFTKTDGCDPTPGGATCEHIQLTKGTYASSSTGKTVKLTSSFGAIDTLAVEDHCYQGLKDPSSGAILYPAP